MSEESTGVIFGQNLPGTTNLGGFDFTEMAMRLSPNILFVILGILAIILGGVTLVLYYHWIRYGFGDRKVLLAQVLYTTVLVLSFIVLISSATYYA
jgi:hypothetical protein